jgi:hypothetical protein
MWDWLFGSSSSSSSSSSQSQQPQPAPSNPAPTQKHGDDCPSCGQAEQECVNNCVSKSAMSGIDPALDMGQASKNAACIAMCEDTKQRCTCGS